jgi:eukaryotic-like serine/threonine-protein kinase
MTAGRSYLAAFAGLHTVASADERRQLTRQALAMLAELADHEPAPLEGIASDQLLLAVRMALSDGLLARLDWMSQASAAVALFELAQALPVSAERRELGRRVLTSLREADRATFVRLLISLARTSPKIVASEGLRARLGVVLAAPLTAPGLIGELAIGLLAQPSLAQSWVEEPATGALPGRRLAARLLAHGAREALRRHDSGDRGVVRVLARPGTRAALARLLGDREALVARFASTARGILAHVDPELADDIDRELRPSSSNSDARRGAASAAAAFERGGAAKRWLPLLVERSSQEPGIARGAILGVAGLAVVVPDEADAFAKELVARAPFESAEALADLRREEGEPLLPAATALALAWLRDELGGDPDPDDDSRTALLHALEAELAGTATSEGIAGPIRDARAALDAGDIPAALQAARVAVEEIVQAADWLERASDDDAVDRRHSLRLLRELDRELFADNALPAVLALADGDPARLRFSRALAAIEAALLAHERDPERGAVAYGGLRIARLRALVRILDGVRASSETDLEPRLAAVRQLMTRALEDQSPLRRAVWAALTRAGDALLRDGHAELTDLLLSWTMAFPDDDFAIVRDASMVPEVEASFQAYTELHAATWQAVDPDDLDALLALVERLGELADALPAEQSPRVESVRLALARLGMHLTRLTAVSSQHGAVETGTVDAIATELGALARRTYGARRRLGLAAADRSAELEAAVRSIETVLASSGDRDARGAALDEAIATSIDETKTALPPAIAVAIERVLVWLARRPIERSEAAATAGSEVLPGWVPLSRMLGGFYVVRPIGRGAGGSVLLAVRAEQRTRPDRELVAVKVPDYSGDAARSLSEQEFERLFREEAGALLALPHHENLARFITFDASAQPKPILVMEFVRGTNLERTLEAGDLTMPRALAIIDDLFAGLEAMHAVRIAHLDVKPPNVVLRDGSGRAVLVDFGLAGRHIRAGCGSPYYGAAEVWADDASGLEPFPTDVYAATCVAFELLTGHLLMEGDSLEDIIGQHDSPQPGAEPLARLARIPQLAALAELVRAGVSRDPAQRPSVTRMRAGFAAVGRELHARRWPIAC